MMDEQIAVGIDIGTTKVCAVVAENTATDRINVLGIGVAESEGLNRGVVVNIDRTVASVQKAIGAAERAADVDVQSVIVGIAGDHIQSFQSRGVVTLADGYQEITARDVERLLEETRRVAMPADRDILHVIPQEFIVDGQEGVLDPIGMNGVRMEANVHIITGLVTAAKNIYRCIEKAGYYVEDIVLEPLASSFSVLHDDEKEVGVALIDIGGGTTDLAIFEDRTIRHTGVIAVAGNKVTDDIRKVCGIMRNQAEKIKREYGCALVDQVDDHVTVELPGIGGRPTKTISQSSLAHVIQPRMEEILEIVGIEIKRSGYARDLSAGAVLTGGGSMIPGTRALANEILGLESRVGTPRKQGEGLWEEVSDPTFATAVGLVLYGLQPGILGRYMPGGPDASLRGGRHQARDQQDSSVMGRIVGRMKEWFDEL
ncbi:MAG: cell division protein FtsA [Bacteroidota bacterium]|nr:cell division protein FtsA [Bacteroidota bacterium]